MKKTLYILLFIVLAASVRAQVAQLPYMCSFEEDEDLSEWILNPGTPDATDKWMYGAETYTEGKRSLYISDNGKDTHFGTNKNVTVAYLRYKFPDATSRKDYDISFDWKCIGVTDASALYLMVCPEQFLLTKTENFEEYYIGDIVSQTSGKLSPKTINACLQVKFNGERAMNNVSQWRNESLTKDFRVNKNYSSFTWAIVFIWVNDNIDPDAQAMGACIDNLQIAPATLRKPTNLNVEPVCDDSTLKVTWESTAANFVVEYRAVGSTTWRRADDLSEGVQYFEKEGLACTYYLTRIKEGSYNVRVKSALGQDTSAYASVSNIVMYCPFNHCINYLDLNNPYLKCTYGFIEGYKGGTPYDNVGYINDPLDREHSRHTIMMDPTELDPNTDTIMLCVPPGELGSVRLGNWDTKYEAESMTYTFSVDSFNASILLVKYAIVLNKPGTSCGDPGFSMELFDENDKPITDLCGVPDFTYSTAAASGNWNETKIKHGLDICVWKDWTTVGINLLQYAGQNIKVRFTTRDCGGGGHFGYGYFCLDCASAYIETENCGAAATVTCNAPEGFSYKWTDENGNVQGYDRQLKADAGYHVYTCRVSFIEDSTCYFEVSTVSAPRFPVPAFNYKIKPEECANRIYFTNKSHIMNKYFGYEIHTSEICDDQEWTFTRFSDGKENQTTNYGPMYVAPPEGDTIMVRLRVFIGENNACDSTLDSLIIVPSIINTDSTEYLELCEGDPYKFSGFYYSAVKDTVLADTAANYAGCDSIYTLTLKVHAKTPEQFRVDSICSDSAIVIGDSILNKPGNYTIFMQNQYGCDSIVSTQLTVNTRLVAKADTENPLEFCADGSQFVIDFSIMDGLYDSITLVFSEEARAVGFKDMITTKPNLTSLTVKYAETTLPGQYTAVLNFHQYCCGVTSFTIPFEIKYSSSIVKQKWNDVLSVLAPAHNGGFSFVSYQWYKNEQPIPGATGSYLYEPLDTTATYYVVLTRADSITVATCPITPTTHHDVTKFPTLVKASQLISVHLTEPMQIRIFTQTGQLYSDQRFGEGQATVVAPAFVGAYIVEMIPPDGEHQTQYLIVGN